MPGSLDLDALSGLRWPTVGPAEPGLVLGIGVEGVLSWSDARGWTATAAGRPLGTGTTFYVASLAKQVTAATVAVFVQEGQIARDESPRHWLPELPSVFDDVVVSDLVHHVSGVASLEPAGTATDSWWSGLDLWDMVARICRSTALAAPPGTVYRYANEGYLLLAAVVERASGTSFHSAAATSLFEPLGMRASYFLDRADAPPPGAVGHSVTAHRLQPDAPDFRFVGDGGLVTTLDDLIRWSTVHAPPHRLGRTLSNLLTTPGTLRDGRSLQYAWGLSVRSHRGRTIHSHGGAFVGNVAKLVQFPDPPATTFVCLANRDDVDVDGFVMQAVDLVLADWLQPGAPDWRATLRPDGVAPPSN